VAALKGGGNDHDDNECDNRQYHRNQLPASAPVVLRALRRSRPHRHCLDRRVLSARSTVVPGAAPSAPIDLAVLQLSRFAWPDNTSCLKNRRVALLVLRGSGNGQ
jgi:hypothetical protein